MPAGARALAIETTSRRGEVALVEDGRILRQGGFEAGLRHAAHLLPLIDQLLRQEGWRPRELAEIYVSVGPGGFTGTRIGVTFAKTLALAIGSRILAVPTAAVLVENAAAEAEHALVVIDARRGSAWVEPFARHEGGWRRSGTPRLTTLGQALSAAPRPIWLVGEGVKYHAGDIENGEAGVHSCPDIYPQVRHVPRIGHQMACAGQFTDPFALEPAYVRRPEAEEKRLEQSHQPSGARMD